MATSRSLSSGNFRKLKELRKELIQSRRTNYQVSLSRSEDKSEATLTVTNKKHKVEIDETVNILVNENGMEANLDYMREEILQWIKRKADDYLHKFKRDVKALRRTSGRNCYMTYHVKVTHPSDFSSYVSGYIDIKYKGFFHLRWLIEIRHLKQIDYIKLARQVFREKFWPMIEEFNPELHPAAEYMENNAVVVTKDDAEQVLERARKALGTWYRNKCLTPHEICKAKERVEPVIARLFIAASADKRAR